MNQDILYVCKNSTAFGETVLLSTEEEGFPFNSGFISMGVVVLALIKAGKTDFFKPQKSNPEALKALLHRHNMGVQGGMERWDSNVFADYYNVDNDLVISLYAEITSHLVQEVEYDGYEYDDY